MNYPGGAHEYYLDILRAHLGHKDAEERVAKFLADDLIAEAEQYLDG